MPQKRNPERSEHLSTLASVVRAAAGQALEAMVAEHERDGAAWKIEWALLPQACGAAAVALALGAELAAGLRVDEQRMRENVDAQRGYVLAEPAMLALGAEIGPRRAHALVEGLTLNRGDAAQTSARSPGSRSRDRGAAVAGAAGGAAAARSSRWARPTSSSGGCSAMTEPPEGYLGPAARSAAGRRRSWSRPATSSSSPTRRCWRAGSGSPTSRTRSRWTPSRPTTAARWSARWSRCWTRRSRSTRATATSRTCASASSSSGSGARRAGSTPAGRAARRGGSRSGSPCARACSTSPPRSRASRPRSPRSRRASATR